MSALLDSIHASPCPVLDAGLTNGAGYHTFALYPVFPYVHRPFHENTSSYYILFTVLHFNLSQLSFSLCD